MDGKVYPPVQTPASSITPPSANPPQPNQLGGNQAENRAQQAARQRQSPNVTPPLRPLIPPSAPNTGYNNSGNIFPPSVGPVNYPAMRSYSPAVDSPRFPLPHPSMGPPQAHVTSSTHPSNSLGNGNADTFSYSLIKFKNNVHFPDNLRGLLSHQNPQQYNHMGNFGPNMTGMERNMTTQQVAAMQQMRNSYMNNQNAAGPFGGNSNQNGQMNSPNVMNSAAAMQRYQQMQNSRQQMINQMRNSSNLMGSNMKNTPGLNFPSNQQPNLPPAQANFNQNNARAAQQAAQIAQMQANNPGGSGNASGGAKWHTPQQKQASNHNSNLNMMGMSMSPPVNNFINDSFKIPLRSPDTLRTQNSSSSNGSFPIPLPNVTSSNPKTPSPSQKDTQKDLSDSIDMVCNESVVDLLATIAKLDSNGVQVVPEGGRCKATSPQVHSSTDAIDQSSINLSDKSNQPKDDPNEDWCAVCMGKESWRFFCQFP